MRGVDAVVHLGVSAIVETPWRPSCRPTCHLQYLRKRPNRQGAAASSTQVRITCRLYRRKQRIGSEEPMRPDSRYGVSKAFGESLGRLYADKYGLSVICQRIGVARPRPPHRRALSNWLSERDYVELTRCCLDAQEVHFLTVLRRFRQQRRLL